MAQDFTRYKEPAVGTSPVTIHTANTNDVLVGISVANILGSTILVDVYLTNSGTFHLVKSAPIPSGGSLQLLAGGAKVVMQNGDALIVKSDTASSADVWVSAVDSVS
tara:strand:- start:545 stop:865 length:321 start_codon:yes stop_codon:yes gene_type:complete